MIKDLDPRSEEHAPGGQGRGRGAAIGGSDRQDGEPHERAEADLLRLKTDLEQGKDKLVFTYAGRKYTKDQVKTDLANRFQRFKTDEATLESMRKIHLARQNSVEAAQAETGGLVGLQAAASGGDRKRRGQAADDCRGTEHRAITNSTTANWAA